MKFNFFEKFGVAGFSAEEDSHTAEFLHNSDPENDNDGLIDWSYWSDVSITPIDAAHLLHAIDVDVRDDADTPLPRQKMQDGLQKDIDKLARWLASKSTTWSLIQLVDTFGAENLNTRMVDAVKSVDAPLVVDDAQTKRSAAHVDWLRELWNKTGRLDGSAFFASLKHHKGVANSPIFEHYTQGKDGAGITVALSNGDRKSITKARIRNLVSDFKKQP